MVSFLNPPLTPRSGNTLRVIFPQRVSSVAEGKQSLVSLDDQGDIQQRWLDSHTDLPLDISVVAGSGSGEILDRVEFVTLLEMIESGKYDLVLTEDLGRIVRRVAAYDVCELCEDHGVRLIAINNSGVDTATPGWRDAAFFAAFFYEKDNRDKSIRLKERLRARFLAGGALPRPIAGYDQPPGAKHEDQVSKNELWVPIYEEWFRKLDEDDALFSEIADWLNEINAPVGAYCRTKTEWDGTMVGQYTRNPILKGLRVHNERQTRRVNATGKYKSEKAPTEHRLEREVPHLAFVPTALYDRVIDKIADRNQVYSRTANGQNDTLKNKAKKRTRFPGQIIECGICGHGYVFGGHGQTDHLMCNGAREYKCWNGITVDGPLAAEKISQAVFREIESLEGFDEAFLASLHERASALSGSRASELQRITSDQQKCERELANLVDFIANGNTSTTIAARISELERHKVRLEHQATELEQRSDLELIIPTIDDVRNVVRESLRDLAIDSFEFSRVMRQLIPKIVVWPVRGCTGGKIYMRSEFTFQTAILLPDVNAREVLAESLERVLTVDLFEPAQPIRFREQVMELRAAINPDTGRKYTKYETAESVGITHTAAQNATKLQRTMNQLGLDDPMVRVTEPPADYPKLKRHKHERYTFSPLPHAGEP